MSDHDRLMQELLDTLGSAAAASARVAPGPWMLVLTGLGALFKIIALRMRNEGHSFEEIIAAIRMPLKVDDTFRVDVDTDIQRKPRRPT